MPGYVPDANNLAEPIDGRPAGTAAAEFRAIKAKLASIVAGAFVATAAGANAQDIQTFIQPDVNDRPAITAGGWLPWNMNQQWGGAPMPFHLIDSVTGTEFKFDSLDSYLGGQEDMSNNSDVAQAVGNFYHYQGFTSSKAQSLQAIWIKVGKVGNPVDNLILKLWSVAAGLPNALIATANVINGKQIGAVTASATPNMLWVRFSFAVVQALVANTQYIFTLEKSGGVDAANYYRLAGKDTVTPFPNNLQGVGTAVPAWTATNTRSLAFIAEPQASDQIVLTAGTYNGRIVGSEGSPINHSVGFCKPIREFVPLLNPNGWSIFIRGKSWTKDRTILDLVYGLHHDRINLRSAVATGFPTVTVYKTDGTVVTITGISDLSANTYKDLMIVGRTMGDGADYIKIYTGINNIWAKEAESLAQTLALDPLMFSLGTGWLMGGFPLFKLADYTKLSDMSALPSGDGWTFTTTTVTVEGTVFAISGGKLNQIKSGMAAAGDGIYLKNALALSNANGWLATHKVRIASGTNTKDANSATFTIEDGAKQSALRHNEYYTEDATLTVVPYPQVDIRSADCTFFSSGKGSDVFHFCNGRMIIDGTGGMVTASANNQIRFGDLSVTANENSDVVWDYVAYYNTANIYPQFTSGELHEFGSWGGDKNLLGQGLYNAGVSLSIKQYCGIQRNYANEQIKQVQAAHGVTATPTTASATPVTVAEMELFVLGADLEVEYYFSGNAGAAISWGARPVIDGFTIPQGMVAQYNTGTSASAEANLATMPFRKRINYGLHKINGTFQTSAGTLSGITNNRSLICTSRSGVG